MKVEIKFRDNSIFEGITTIIDNITEIHYNYETVLKGKRIAFESDIDGTGCTYYMEDIEWFEAK